MTGQQTAGLAGLLAAQDLFRFSDGVIRVPHLVRGRLVAPPELPHRRIRSAFTAAGAGTRHLRLDGAQIIAEPLVDRSGPAGTVTGGHRYLVLPDCDPLDLVEWDLDRLATGPYAAPYDAVVDLVDAAGALLAGSTDLLATLRDLVLATAPQPASTLTDLLATLPSMMDGAALRGTADHHLSTHGHPGTAYLDGWVDLTATPPAAADETDEVGVAGGSVLRAVPTRQLQLAAERPLGAVEAVLRVLGSKGAGTVRLPGAGVLPGALVAAALSVAAGINHPMLRHLSVVHWRSGDPAVEAVLFAPESFDRTVVGGQPRRRVALIDLSTVDGEAARTETAPGEVALGEVAALGAADVCRHEAAGNAAVHYVVGSRETAERYAVALRAELLTWHEKVPPVVPPGLAAALVRLRRGRLAQASWHPDPLNPHHLRPEPPHLDPPHSDRLDPVAAGEVGLPVVVVAEGGVEVGELPGGRFVVVRRVEGVGAAVRGTSREVGSVGVWPAEVRVAVRDRLAARRVGAVGALGAGGPGWDGGPFGLAELVDWTRG